MSGLSLSNDLRKNTEKGSRESVFATSSYRYEVTIKTFLRKDGMGLQITKDKQDVDREIRQLTDSR
jgi:hypothetical protein